MALFPDVISDVATKLIEKPIPWGIPAELFFLYEIDAHPTLVKGRVPLRLWGDNPVGQIEGFATNMVRFHEAAVPSKTPHGFTAVFLLFDLVDGDRVPKCGRGTPYVRYLTVVDITGAVYVLSRPRHGQVEQYWSHPLVDARPESPIVDALSVIVETMKTRLLG